MHLLDLLLNVTHTDTILLHALITILLLLLLLLNKGKKVNTCNTLSITIQFNNQNIVQKDNHLICS